MSDDDPPPVALIICTAVVLMGILCIYTLCVMPITDWLLGWGFGVGCLLIVGAIFVCCKKWGDGCHGTEVLPQFDIDMDD